MNFILSFLKGKNKNKNFFDLPSKEQKRILSETARKTSVKKKQLLEEAGVSYTN